MVCRRRGVGLTWDSGLSEVRIRGLRCATLPGRMGLAWRWHGQYLEQNCSARPSHQPSDQSRWRKWVSPLGPPGSRCATKSPWLVGVAAAIHEIEIDELIGSQLRHPYGGSQTDACFRSSRTPWLSFRTRAATVSE